MSKYYCRQIEFSPVLNDKEEKILQCVNEMDKAGYRLDVQADTGFGRMVLVFQGN